MQRENKLLRGIRAVASEYRIGLSTAKKLIEEAPHFRIGNIFYCYSEEIEEYLKNKEKNGK